MRRRVAVTGLGIVTSHGLGQAVNRESVLSGRTSIREITLFDSAGYRANRAGQVAKLPTAPWTRFRPSRLDRASHLLHHAFAEALEDSGLSASGLASARPVVALGTTLGGMGSGERYHAEYLAKGAARARLSLLYDHLAHCQPIHLMEEFSLPGVPAVFSNACASGASAVGHAFHAVRAGRARAAVCGGYDPLCEFVVAGFHSLQALTAELCRPFDLNRSGLVIGEGAGVLVLEEWEAARERGARIAGEIAGFGESTDAFHMTRPDPEGQWAALAIRRALADAGAGPDEIDYVNAHGTGTPFNDTAEAAALFAALGERAAEIPVSSTKPQVGHVLGGAGAVEAIFTLMALAEGRLPPHANYETPDPACGLRVVRGAQARPERLRTALSNSFGFGGANAVLLLKAAGDGAA
ncbi:MAG: beta-ketoacyl-[acyl-carrier-protein] synthase family protein [Deltaproteobacteria bacterium]